MALLLRAARPLSLLLLACATPPPAPPAALPTAASESLCAARQLMRLASAGDHARRAEARVAALRALELAPGWVAAERLLDDCSRDALRGPEALAARLADLHREPADPQTLYLAGRLMGGAGEGMLRRALELDSSDPWLHHGVAWTEYRAKRTATAIVRGRRALELARDPCERSQFAYALSRYLDSSGREEEALGVLGETLYGGQLWLAERDWIEFELCLLELSNDDDQIERRGAARAVGMARARRLSFVRAQRLLPLVRFGSSDLYDSLYLALDPALRVRLRSSRFGAQGTLLDQVLAEQRVEHGLRRAYDRWTIEKRLSSGQVGLALEGWLAGLPRFLLNGQGLPVARNLRALVECGRECAAHPEQAVAVAAFGDALIRAGWFAEAVAYASSLPLGDLEVALELEARGRAGAMVLHQLKSLVRDVGRGKALLEPSLGDSVEWQPPTRELVDDLNELEGEIAGLFPAALPHLAGEPLALRLQQELAASPRIRHGWLGEMIHPGPVFSGADEAAGLGQAGEHVPGLAAAFGLLGRFAIIGEAIVGAPDASVSRVLHWEQRSGEHLGSPWSGTVVWVEGQDVTPNGILHGGGAIAGLALHEGYWVDLSVVRSQVHSWEALAERFEEDPEALVDALEGRPPSTSHGVDRRSLTGTLGEHERLALTVMRERAVSAGGTRLLLPLGIEEALQVTAIHEEGHLTDHVRFLPLGRKWPQALWLLSRTGLSPAAVTRELELRAELIALCCAPDPRVPLTHLLAAAELEGRGSTHTRAYYQLLEEFVELLDRRLEAEPERFGAFDPGRQLVQQLHHLGPEQVRELGLVLARGRALMEE